LKTFKLYDHACPPYVTYGQEMSIDMETFLTADPETLVLDDGISMVEVLPVHYPFN
jgi:hypothetical protein